MADFRIETDRLILREWVDSDRLILKNIINTPGMMRYFGALMTDEEYDQFFERFLDDQRRGGFCYWAVTLKRERRLIGTCGLRKADDYPAESPVFGMHEIGWRIGEDWWRQGFALEAAKGVVKWLWANSDAEILAAWTSELNVPSQSLMRRLGMIRRVDLDYDHHRVPDDSKLKRHVTYCISRDSFLNAR
jgi:RimJ/RimL family protein N-acetyltransferase